jgi:drug/metabolite transporter (DMT)-like permease
VPASAIVLVLIAACCHACWNLVAKRAGGGLAFLWLFGAFASAGLLPVAIWTMTRSGLAFGRPQLIACLGSGFIHIFYFSLLQAGYRDGDLSVVYPVARGVGPLISAFVGITVLGEDPGTLAIIGGLLLLGGVVAMSGLSPGSMHLDKSVVFGLLCGVSIAAYTLWDRRAVATLELPAVFYYWATTLAYTAFISPLVFRRAELPWGTVFFHRHWRPALLVAALSAASYSLVLYAMTYAPLSYVATLRESSILIATVLGVVYLGEPLTKRKLIAALAIVLGIIGLAVG